MDVKKGKPESLSFGRQGSKVQIRNWSFGLSLRNKFT